MKVFYHKNAHDIGFLSPGMKLSLLGGGAILLLSGLSMLLKFLLLNIPMDLSGYAAFMDFLHTLDCASVALLAAGSVVVTVGLIWHIKMRDTTKIRLAVKKCLFCPSYGNPLHLQDWQRIPKISCRDLGMGRYELKLTATSVTVEDIQKISSNISSCLNKRFKRYAVIQTDSDLAYNHVMFIIDDVTVDRSLTVHNPKELQGEKPTLIPVQKGTSIDLTTSGSIILSGKTRSGKSTAAISILISALCWGRDKFGSEIIIIDPKSAELSRLPYVYAPDEDGGVHEILDAMRHFADTMKKRQQILNDLSEQKGDVFKWWQAGMHVSFLFIDEYVALRSLFPKRATKDDGGYNLAEFDNLLKRIITMGASAGCYAIISIAEASVDEGGLPAMLRSAMSTKILLRPTLPEGHLLWNGEKLKDFNAERVYKPGDAWFSSTDGIHDSVSLVHFPIMEFQAYKELGLLLERYYEQS